jgi:dihydroorotase
VQTVTLTCPDDWHVHFRDGQYLATTVPATARCFRRAIAMPNLKPAVTSVDKALAYYYRIKAAVPAGVQFEPLMTLYLTNETDAKTIHTAHQTGFIKACKLYPAGATTHSADGVTDIEKTFPALAAMEALRMPLLIHGEVTDPDVDIFDREKIFLDKVLRPIKQRFPQLPVVLEHITTSEAVDFVNNTPGPIGATITVHHLLYHRNALFDGGIRPHLYCLPILKRQQHQQALIQAATSGNPRFFLGTDSAPHTIKTKEAACGCAGIYSAHAALELYADIFAKAGALDKLEGFASFFGPDFYGLPRNQEKITLSLRPWQVPTHYEFGDDTVIPLGAGETLRWSIDPL